MRSHSSDPCITRISSQGEGERDKVFGATPTNGGLRWLCGLLLGGKGSGVHGLVATLWSLGDVGGCLGGRGWWLCGWQDRARGRKVRLGLWAGGERGRRPRGRGVTRGRILCVSACGNVRGGAQLPGGDRGVLCTEDEEAMCGG